MRKENDVKKKSTYSRLIGYLLKYKGSLFAGVFFNLISVLMFAAAPYFLGMTINNFTAAFAEGASEEVQTQFFITILLTVAAFILYAVFNVLCRRLYTRAAQNAVYDLRMEIDGKLNRLPLNYFDTVAYGDILSKATNDVMIVSNMYQQAIFQVVNSAFTLVVFLVMMLVISGWLTLAGVAVIPITIIVFLVSAKKASKLFDKRIGLEEELNGYVDEYYNGHNVVKLFGKENEVIDKSDTLNDDLYEASVKSENLTNFLQPFTQGMGDLGYAIVCLVGALMAIAGGLSIGEIQTFSQYLTQLTMAITNVMMIISVVQQSKSAGNGIFEFIDEEEEVPDVEDPKYPEKVTGKIDFNHVQFGYPSGKTLIHDLDIHINPGEKVGVVGPTGAGKSTMINLVMRFYDVTGGSVTLDGVDLRDMGREALRKNLGMVLQDTWLYSGTIMENIRYGRLDATDEEVIQAAKDACADGFIQTLPGGYNFMLREGASNLAQGQRQLLTIARAMLANAPITILDEATSSVDTRTELIIQGAMDKMTKGRTSFMIAHRLSTIKDAAVILYMQDGDILEIGSHDELMAKNGLYADLYNSQFASNA